MSDNIIWYNVRKTPRGVARELLRLYKTYPEAWTRGTLGRAANGGNTSDPEEACSFCVSGLASLVCGAKELCYVEEMGGVGSKFARAFKAASNGHSLVYTNDLLGKDEVLAVLEEMSHEAG